MGKISVASLIQNLLQSQSLAVLATSDGGNPHCSLIFFSSTDDLQSIVFATQRQTKKYQNLQHNCRVSLVIDNRPIQGTDLSQGIAVTAQGCARELKPQEKAPFLLHHLIKHPELVEFTDSPHCALILIEIEVYYVVQKLQVINELRTPIQ